MVKKLKDFDPKKLKKDDVVFIKGDDPKLPYIAQVTEVDHKGARVNLRWFFRPEDVKGGRQMWHGERELFKQQSVTDWNSMETVEGLCLVHTLEEYEDLEYITEADHFWRFRYNPSTGAFKPDIVPVYCVCEIPYNPDRAMVECDKCKDWFHYDCIGLTEDSPECKQGYTCAECDPRKKKQKVK